MAARGGAATCGADPGRRRPRRPCRRLRPRPRRRQRLHAAPGRAVLRAAGHAHGARRGRRGPPRPARPAARHAPAGGGGRGGGRAAPAAARPSLFAARPGAPRHRGLPPPPRRHRGRRGRAAAPPRRAARRARPARRPPAAAAGQRGRPWRRGGPLRGLLAAGAAAGPAAACGRAPGAAALWRGRRVGAPGAGLLRVLPLHAGQDGRQRVRARAGRAPRRTPLCALGCGGARDAARARCACACRRLPPAHHQRPLGACSPRRPAAASLRRAAAGAAPTARCRPCAPGSACSTTPPARRPPTARSRRRWWRWATRGPTSWAAASG